MTTRNRLKNGVSSQTFMHLSAIPQNTEAAGPATAGPAASAAVAPAAPQPEASAQVSESKADDVRDADDEDDEDDDEDDDDPEGDEEEVKKAMGGEHRSLVQAARRVERRRCAAIFGSKHAAGRVPMAAELAFSTDMKPSAAVKVLRASAQESPGNPLATALAAMPRHDIGADAAAKAGAETPDQKLMAAARSRTKGPEKK